MLVFPQPVWNAKGGLEATSKTTQVFLALASSVTLTSESLIRQLRFGAATTDALPCCRFCSMVEAVSRSPFCEASRMSDDMTDIFVT
jgi:hypothetical protein